MMSLSIHPCRTPNQMEYEQLFLKGIPCLRGPGDIIYNYDRTNPVRMGRIIGELSLDADCLERLQPSLLAWRAGLKPCERGKIKPEAKPKKQTAARRATGGGAAAGGAGATRSKGKKGRSTGIHSDDE